MKLKIGAVLCLFAAVVSTIAQQTTVADKILPSVAAKVIPNDMVLIDSEQLKNIMGLLSGQPCVNVLNLLTSATPEQLQVYLASTTTSLGDWEFVFQQLFEKKEVHWATLLKVGANLKFGHTKILFYLSLLKFLNSKRANSKVAEVFSLRYAVNSNINCDAIARYNPAFDFLKLEQKLLPEIGDVVANAIVEKQLLGNPSVNLIPWKELWEVGSKFNDEPLILGKVLSHSIAENWSKIDLASIVEQINRIPSDSENDKVKKLHFYSALLNGANTHIRDGARGYLALVSSFKHFQQNLQFADENSIAWGIVEHLNGAIHGCAKAVLNLPATGLHRIVGHESNDTLIGFTRAHEKSSFSDWNIMPKDLNQNTYLPVFLWSGQEIKTADRCSRAWVIERDVDDSRFWLHPHGRKDIYLDVEHSTDALFVASNTRLDKHAFDIIPSTLFDDACHIVNIQSGRILNAAKYYFEKRYRVINSYGDCYGPRSHWCIKDFVGTTSHCIS